MVQRLFIVSTVFMLLGIRVCASLAQRLLFLRRKDSKQSEKKRKKQCKKC